jgi:7-keto-8-aminopelargonate synthetase-like enzyme
MVTGEIWRILSNEFPAVPKELERLRISIMADHTSEDLERLSMVLERVLY